MDLASSWIVPQAEEGLGTVYYIPDFVSRQEEDYLIQKISDAPLTAWRNLSNRRLQVYGGDVSKPSNVLLQKPLPSFLIDYPNIIPRLKDTGAFKLSKHGQPNHVLVNEYRPGQGIMPHQDGPSYHPVVATISLGSHTVVHYYRHRPLATSEPDVAGRSIDPDPILSVFLEPRSLVITTGELYIDALHGIEAVAADHFAMHGDDSEMDEEASGNCKIANWEMVTDEACKRCLRDGKSMERSTRISLTCRDVEKVMPGNGSLLGRR